MQALRDCSSFFVVLLLTAAPSWASQREALETRPKLDFAPFTGTWKTRVELIPILAGDLVLATTTLRLFAFDAATAELRWSAGPPEGWDGLEPAERGRLIGSVEARRLWIAPAASERVAVAALQVPLSRESAEEWQGIQISTPLPERRLFAFELATGRPIWNHAPPRDWDRSSGSDPERMTVVGSPTVTGDAVLVPCASDLSSIDYHVACYHLGTGAMLWSTFVVRGQLERNMFGRATHEFAAAPLVVLSGSRRVLAQTGLGRIAALDLATGSVLWSTEYETIPPPRTRSYTPPRREYVWRTAPPLVVGDVLLATPPDSRELLALDLADGHVLWSVAAAGLVALDRDTNELDFDHLIGADENVIYLGGRKVSALVKPGSLSSQAPPSPLWTERIERADVSGRWQLAGSDLVLPGPDECLVLDRENGHSRGARALEGTPRGLLVTDESIYTLADDGLHRIER